MFPDNFAPSYVDGNSREIYRGMVVRSSIGCYRDIWDKLLKSDKSELFRIIKETERGNSCFYYEYKEGILFEGAVKLEEKQSKNAELKRQLLYSTVGLWIAGVSLFVTLGWDVFKFIFNLYHPVK